MDEIQHNYWMWVGILKGLAKNLCNAMLAEHYVTKIHPLTSYATVTLLQILNYVGEVWVLAKKKPKKEYYT